jgi:hypothetical protein
VAFENHISILQEIPMKYLSYIFVVSAFLTGCGQPGQVYEKPMVEVQKVLEQTELPPMILNAFVSDHNRDVLDRTAKIVVGSDAIAMTIDAPNFPVDFDRESNDPSKVTWIIKKNGMKIFRYDADLTPVSDKKTRVIVTMKSASEEIANDSAKKLLESPNLVSLYTVAMEEKIASTIEQRPFDMRKINAHAQRVGVSSHDNMATQLDVAAEASGQNGQDNIKKAYAAETMGGH